MVLITALPLRNRIDDLTVANFPWNSDDMVSFEVAVRDGHFAVISDDVERLTGTPPRSLRDLRYVPGTWAPPESFMRE